ncbi:hybrid sensor histidine kinase/response regulator transcription factor [Mucilaginibacter pedocola]|nr:ATP-binding protein [Mucilaginibacter pedocola]
MMRPWALLFLFLFLRPFAVSAQTHLRKPFIDKLQAIGDIDSAKRYADSLTGIAKTQNDKLFEAKVLFTLSYKYYKKGLERVALDYAHQAGKVASPADSTTYVQTQTMIAWMLSRNGDTQGGLKTAFAILRETEKHGWKTLRIDCKVCIADLFRPVHNIANSVKFSQQAADEALTLRDTGRYISALSMVAYGYGDMRGKNDAESDQYLAKAVTYLQQLLAKPFADKLGTFQKINLMGNLGTFYEGLEKYDEAEAILNKALALATEQKFLTLQKHDLNQLMSLNVKRKHFDKAVAYANQVLALQSEANSSRPLQLNVYKEATKAYAGARDFEKAYKYSEKARVLNDSMLADGQSKATAELDKKYQNDKQLLLAANRNTLLKQERNFIILIAVILLISGAIVYRWYVLKKQKEAKLLAEENRQLARLDNLKSKFLANVSHELKTPLTLIMGPAQQLLDGSVTPVQQQSNLLTIGRNSKKLLGIVNELLDIGKLEAGNHSLRLAPVNLQSLVRLIYQSFASAAEYKNITYTLTANIDEGLFVSIDKDKFEKIANNFISNAIKFTPAYKSVNVVATFGKGMLVFSVEDNGNGIYPDDLPYVFDRYYQGKQDEKVAEGGTGIGLSIAKEFAELMGGRIEVANRWGEGALFTAHIPLAEVIVTQSEIPVAISAVAKPAYTAFASEVRPLILLAEDHAEMSAYISSVLGPYYDTLVASNGKHALQLLETSAQLPALIVSDAMMPEMNGFELLEKLKADQRYYHIPVIMLTALTDNQNRIRALNIGVDDYLAKPFVAEELLARTANLLNNASGRATVGITDAEDAAESAQMDAADNSGLENKPTSNSPADLVWLAGLEETVRQFIGTTDLNLAMLSYEMAISERQLFRRIKSITGLTPNKYIRTIRLQIAREAIDSGKYRTMAEIAYLAGFETPAYFSKLFKEHYGRDISGLL